MKKLGTAQNVIHDGTILLNIDWGSTPELPVQGMMVFDQRGVEVGRVARVFGPVRSPYVSLKPRPNVDALGLIGASLYLDPEAKPPQRARQTVKRTFVKKGGFRHGSDRKKGVKGYRRKEKPRKK